MLQTPTTWKEFWKEWLCPTSSSSLPPPAKCPSLHFTRLVQDGLCIPSITELGITLHSFSREPGPSERFKLPLLILEPTLSCLQRIRNFVQAPSKTAGSVPLLHGEQAVESPPILSLILFPLWCIVGCFLLSVYFATKGPCKMNMFSLMGFHPCPSVLGPGEDKHFLLYTKALSSEHTQDLYTYDLPLTQDHFRAIRLEDIRVI